MYLNLLALAGFLPLLIGAEPLPLRPSPCPNDSPSQVVGDPSFELPTPTAGFNEGPWTVVPVRDQGATFGPLPEYDLSGATSHSGLGAL
jgi:hypothetical protein